MMNLYSWIMGIVGAICLTVLIDVMMQDGETKKYVKGITALIVLAVIIAPLPKLLNEGFEFDQTIQNYANTANKHSLNNDFIYAVNQEKADELSINSQYYLKQNGFENVKITCYVDYCSDFKLRLVNVDLSQLVINKNVENININDEIIQLVLKATGANKDQIVILN